jgi:hypothetical protein
MLCSTFLPFRVFFFISLFSHSGPYALVIVFLAVLVLSGVVPLLATANFRNNYPMIPAVTPFPADTVRMDCPLNIDAFHVPTTCADLPRRRARRYFIYLFFGLFC